MKYLEKINYVNAVHAFKKMGYRVVKESKHISMTNGKQIITFPRVDHIDPLTLVGIAKDVNIPIE